MLEHESRIDKIKAVVRIRKRAIRFDYLRVVQERIRKYCAVNITPLDVCAPAPQVEQSTAVINGVVENMLSSPGAEIKNAMVRTQKRIDLGV